jgi:hypothetical protein
MTLVSDLVEVMLGLRDHHALSLYMYVSKFHFSTCLAISMKVACVHLFQPLNKFTDFCVTWYEYYATAGHSAMLENFLQPAVTAWQMCEHITWE